uniref:Uncharacterized protein n=1 Tax=Brassica oleracea var. oleracea TaxID=109376 RepID=A0A0D3A5D2_BRAOL
MLVPEIKIVHMSFTTELNNNSTTQQVHYLPLVSARWDLLIRVPGKLVGDYICLQGNLQASFLYKNVSPAAATAESAAASIPLVVVRFAAADSAAAAAVDATCCSFLRRRTLPQPQTQKIDLVLFI